MKIFTSQSIPLARTINNSKRNQSYEFIDNRSQFYQLKKLKDGLQSDATLLQMGRRPAFSSRIKRGTADIRRRTKKAFDLAHRLSYRDIESLVRQYWYQPRKLNEFIRVLTIPQRQYGCFPMGYRGYYDKVIKAKMKIYTVISMLNSSPFNLRPGAPSVNRSIGAAPDLHHQDEDPARPLTPQSAALAPYAIDPDPGKSSDLFSGKEAKEAEETLTKPFVGF